MRVTQNHLAVAAILTLACSDSIGPPAPTTGALAITVVTSGAAIDVDPDGYAYSIDGGPGQSLAVNGAVTIVNLPTGSHVIILYGLSPNCFISGGNPRHAVVNASGVASLVAFNVTCDPPTTGGECGGVFLWECSYSSQIVGANEIRYPLMLRGKPSESVRGL